MQGHQRLVILAFLAGLVASRAEAALSEPTGVRVGFQASGPAGLRIEGTTSELIWKQEGGTFVLDVPLENLTTGIHARDQDMKEKYLEVHKFPSATLTLADSGLKLPPAGQKVEGDTQATVRLHGQVRPVVVHYDARAEGQTVVAHGRFHLNMNDFGIPSPIYLGVAIKPDIDVTAAFRVVRN